MNRVKASFLAMSLVLLAVPAWAQKPFDKFEGHPPFHIRRMNTLTPVGLDPGTIKNVYNLPSTGGSGTIAVIDAYDDPNIADDLNVFSAQFGLPLCNAANPCFEKHPMSTKMRTDSGWALEESLDAEWAHAIAPGAKVLLVEAKSSRGNDLLAAIDYARQRPDVIAISMSWSGGEFSSEAGYDFHFVSNYGAVFFAASGDSGSGVQWPAVSPNVVGVGGTTLNLMNGQLSSEIAWSGSGGGLSAYESEPSYQASYGVPGANGMRAVPDVSYDADPATGVAVYDSVHYQGQKGWFEVGGTSIGAPQWAAIQALSGRAASQFFYSDASSGSYTNYFRDITIGTNGTCGFYCLSTLNYDYVTGLGSPVTTTY